MTHECDIFQKCFE